MNNTIIPHSNEVKYLGLIFDRRLTWSSHLKNRLKKLNSRLHQLGPLLRSNLALPLKLILCKTLLQPLWVYGLVILDSNKNQIRGLSKPSRISAVVRARLGRERMGTELLY